MPPKLPNMKFKPKSDTRVKEEDDEDHPDLMSLVQRERLKQLQLQQVRDVQTHQRSNATQVRPEMHVGNAPSNGTTRRANETEPAVGGGVKVENGVGSGEPSGVSSKGLIGAMRQRAAATLASAKYAEYEGPSAAASQNILPYNTMESFLCGEAGNDVTNATSRGSLIRPAPLNSLRGVEGADMSQRENSASIRVDPQAGTAFLEEWRRETKSAHATNSCFFTMDDSGVVAGPREGELMWLQLPKPVHEGGVPSLKQLPLGKIGSMRVHKSGKCVLTIAGVEYDVSVSHTGGEKASCGIAQVAVATHPPMTVGGKPSCFELGAVTSKLMCTPILPE